MHARNRFLDWAANRAVLALAIVLACSIAALGAAFVAEFLFGIVGCTLCVYQRIPYALCAAIAFVAIVARPSPAGGRRVVALCAAIFMIGCGLAAYHVGVQQDWWAEPSTCKGSLSVTTTITDLRAALAAGGGRPACSEIDWSLHGFSLAALNCIYSGILTLGCGFFVLRFGPGILRRPD